MSSEEAIVRLRDELAKRAFHYGDGEFHAIEYCDFCGYSRQWIADHDHGAGCILRPSVTPQQAKIIANFAHAMLHVLDDWAAEDAQTGECEVEIPADQWKELNRVLDLLGDDPHAVMHRAIGVELERNESAWLEIPDILRNEDNLAAERPSRPPGREQAFDPMPFVGMPADDSPLSHQEIFSAVLHHASEIVKLTQCVPAECLGTLPEYESVGYQYKFHGAFGGVTWRDSSNDYNGSRYVESREIFAKRPTATKSGEQPCAIRKG